MTILAVSPPMARSPPMASPGANEPTANNSKTLPPSF
jgi:hypothetical protein